MVKLTMLEVLEEDWEVFKNTDDAPELVNYKDAIVGEFILKQRIGFIMGCMNSKIHPETLMQAKDSSIKFYGYITAEEKYAAQRLFEIYDETYEGCYDVKDDPMWDIFIDK